MMNSNSSVNCVDPDQVNFQNYRNSKEHTRYFFSKIICLCRGPGTLRPERSKKLQTRYLLSKFQVNRIRSFLEITGLIRF